MTTTLVTFLISSACAVTLILFKQWELRHDRVLCPNVRGRADRWVIRSAVVLQKRIPRIGKMLARQTATFIAYQTSAILLSAVRIVERRLVRFSNMIKGHHEIRRGERVSAFLRNVSEHKQKNNGGNQ